MTYNFYQTIKTLYKCEFNLKETLIVLTHDRSIFWSWGVSKKYNLENKVLILKVSGHFHKGYVAITLDWTDTYIVTFLTTTGRILKTVDTVYFDELVHIIDNNIESVEGLLKKG
jgi:hypothetical protein